VKNTRYLWLKRPENLTEKQLDWLDELLLQPRATVRVYEQALKFDDFYELRDPAGAEEYLRGWVTEAKASELEPLVQFAEMLEAHWSGVIRWQSHPRVERAAGRLEFAHPGSQAQSPRVPLSAQLHDDDLPRRWQAPARTSGHIRVVIRPRWGAPGTDERGQAYAGPTATTCGRPYRTGSPE
jgi:Transposase